MRSIFPETHYVERIDDLIHIIAGPAAGPIRERVRALLIEIFEQVRFVLDLDLLMKAELRQQEFNIPGLRRVLNAYANAPRLPDVEVVFRAAGNEPSDWVGRLQQNLSELESGDVPQDALTRFASLTLILSKRFSDLQLGCITAGPHVEVLEDELRSAVNGWSDEGILRQLRECQAEFSVQPSMFAFPDTLAPAGLLSAQTVDEAKTAIVRYVASWRPALVQQWILKKGEQWPDRAPSIASIIALAPDRSSVPLPREPHRTERAAFDIVLRVFSIATQIFHHIDDEVQSVLAIKRSLRNLRTVADWISRWEKNRGASFLELLLVEMKALARALGLLGQSTAIDAVLRSYKLRNEVACHPPHNELSETLHELRFQKHVCAYLLDNGIASFGTKFARSETDLIIDMHKGDERFAVEAKIIRSLHSPTNAIKAINQGFVQLKKYMNDTPMQRRGILLVYSFAPMIITFPREWVRYQYRIVVVDLAVQPPSKRLLSIAIEEGEPSGGCELLVYDTSPDPKTVSHLSEATESAGKKSARGVKRSVRLAAGRGRGAEDPKSKG